jgi:hypothetical protein
MKPALRHLLLDHMDEVHDDGHGDGEDRNRSTAARRVIPDGAAVV